MSSEARSPWVWSPEYHADIGIHVFPMIKYRLVMERLTGEGTLDVRDRLLPVPATREDLLSAHDPDWVDKVLAGALTPMDELRLELPFSEGLRRAVLLCCGGTVRTARLALQRGGVVVHLGGGFHHAFAGHGEGFCLLNDVAVAAAVLRREGAVDRIAIVDLDVHHGNGTAAIFRDDPTVFTFSMHQEANYPFPKPPGDLDVPLEDGIGDAEYLALLRPHLSTVLGWEPELVIYLAGADPYREDQLGGLSLSRTGLRERDRLVFGQCAEEGIPVAVVLAGGYARRREDTVEIHCETVRQAVAAGGTGGASPGRN